MQTTRINRRNVLEATLACLSYCTTGVCICDRPRQVHDYHRLSTGLTDDKWSVICGSSSRLPRRSLQTACGVTRHGHPSNPVLHTFFSIASTLGDEAFYSVALPLCAWTLDLELSRRLAFFWASTYYVGQSIKARERYSYSSTATAVLRIQTS